MEDLFIKHLTENNKNELLSFIDNEIDSIQKTKILNISFMAYSSMGDAKMVDLLLKKGADVNFKDPVGRTALMLTCYNGHYKVIEILNKYGADWHLTNNRNWDAFHYLRKSESEFKTKIFELAP